MCRYFIVEASAGIGLPCPEACGAIAFWLDPVAVLGMWLGVPLVSAEAGLPGEGLVPLDMPGDMAPDVELGPMVLVGDAVLPGDRPGAVSTGAFGAPVGAGAGEGVWAQAILVEAMNAAEASQSLRMINSCCRISLMLQELGRSPGGNKNFRLSRALNTRHRASVGVMESRQK
jgi:hypothetical protein